MLRAIARSLGFVPTSELRDVKYTITSDLTAQLLERLTVEATQRREAVFYRDHYRKLWQQAEARIQKLQGSL